MIVFLVRFLAFVFLVFPFLAWVVLVAVIDVGIDSGSAVRVGRIAGVDTAAVEEDRLGS